MTATRRTHDLVTAVMDTEGVQCASSAPRFEAALARRPGVASVQLNAVAQTATVQYEAAATSVAQLREWIDECHLHCAGESLPAGYGGHGGMSMDAMVADMRRRFLVAAVFSIPIVLWSPIGR